MINFIEYIKQLWDTTSYVNPTRMNHMEDGIKGNSDAVVDLNEALDDVDTLIGDTSISGIGDGTVTGAISAVNVNLTNTLKVWASDEIQANTTKTYDYGAGAYLIVGQGGVSGAKYVSFLVGYGNGASDRTINKEIMNGNSQVQGVNLTISQTESKVSITPAVTMNVRIYKLI